MVLMLRVQNTRRNMQLQRLIVKPEARPIHGNLVLFLELLGCESGQVKIAMTCWRGEAFISAPRIVAHSAAVRDGA